MASLKWVLLAVLRGVRWKCRSIKRWLGWPYGGTKGNCLLLFSATMQLSKLPLKDFPTTEGFSSSGNQMGFVPAYEGNSVEVVVLPGLAGYMPIRWLLDAIS